MRESEGTAPCIIFRERSEGPRGGASRNRKHCKLKGKGPVRGFSKYQYSGWLHENYFQAVDAWQPDEPVYCFPFFPSAQSCCPFKLLYRHWVHVVCDDARLRVVVIFKAINLSINVSPPLDMVRVSAHSVCRCHRLKTAPVKSQLQVFHFGLANDQLSRLGFLCSGVSSLPCVFTQQRSDFLCCAVPPHTDGSMVGDNDKNPLPGPGSLITPSLVGSFHTILTSVDSSCQNSCLFLSFTFPYLLKNCLGINENCYNPCLVFAHKSPPWQIREQSVVKPPYSMAYLPDFIFVPTGYVAVLCSLHVWAVLLWLDCSLSFIVYLHEIRVYIL